MGTFKEDFYKSIKEKADPTLYLHYQEERQILDDDLLQFYGSISKEAREFFEGYIVTQLDYMCSLEKDLIYDYTFIELCKVWREVIFGDAPYIKVEDIDRSEEYV